MFIALFASSINPGASRLSPSNDVDVIAKPPFASSSVVLLEIAELSHVSSIAYSRVCASNCVTNMLRIARIRIAVSSSGMVVAEISLIGQSDENASRARTAEEFMLWLRAVVFIPEPPVALSSAGLHPGCAGNLRTAAALPVSQVLGPCQLLVVFPDRFP